MLSKLEKKLLYILDEDSGQSLTEIGKKAGITPQLVKYHLERLEQGRFILAYWPMIDFRKLGYSNTSYFLKLKNLTSAKEKEVLNYLNKIPEYNIVMLGDGYWDLHFTISAQGIFQTVQLFNNFFDEYHEIIHSYETAISVGFYQFRRDYLNDDNSQKPINKYYKSYTGGEVDSEKMSKNDLKVIEVYNNNCRSSYSKLARLSGISRDRVIYTLKKLKAKGILQNNSILFDHEKAGFPLYRILMQMSNLTSDKFLEFYEYCGKNPNIVHLLRLFGNWQALIDVEVESRDKLRGLFKEIKNKFSDLIIRLESTQVYQVEKFRDIPDKLK